MFTKALVIASASAIKVRETDPTSNVDDIELDLDQLDKYYLNVTEAYDEINDTWYPMNEMVSLEDIVDFVQA